MKRGKPKKYKLAAYAEKYRLAAHVAGMLAVRRWAVSMFAEIENDPRTTGEPIVWPSSLILAHKWSEVLLIRPLAAPRPRQPKPNRRKPR